MNQKLMRFDVRLRKEDYASSLWDRTHRNRFLLSQATDWPLSVDPLVWPSIFFSNIFTDATKLASGSIEVDPIIDGGDYWLNLEQMRRYYDANKPPNSEGVFVCFSLYSEAPLTGFSTPYLKDGIQYGLRLHDTIPNVAPTGSVLLGYDVADASWISGLSNCGYTADEKKELAIRWLPRLNSFGLLKDLDGAAGFREVCDRRIPDHAPFQIFGIFQLPIGLSIKG